jgi:hypothetical protein
MKYERNTTQAPENMTIPNLGDPVSRSTKGFTNIEQGGKETPKDGNGKAAAQLATCAWRILRTPSLATPKGNGARTNTTS